MTIKFTVQGKPQPQGSTRAFMPKGARFPIVTTDNRNLKPWRQDVASQAKLAMQAGNHAMSESAISVRAAFYFLKPKSAKKSIQHKITKPDIDKLVRGIFDSLTGICFHDDSQVVHCEIAKLFTPSDERAEISVREMLTL